MERYYGKAVQIMDEVNKVVMGKREIVAKVLAAILAKGHILLEDNPGVGKTTLALAFSKAMELNYHRLQFTPDVLPSDVVGFNMISNGGVGYEYRPGAIICNLFLADEINRTSPKTQSALLEVMEEGKVTVDSVTREMPKPFTVIATQNPIGSVGTQMLPESQLDRFIVKLSMGYPDTKSEIMILKHRQNINPLDNVITIANHEDIITMQSIVENVFIHDSLYEYITLLVEQTRSNPLVDLGVSPRGSLAIMNMAKAIAFINNRDYVIPNDIQYIFKDVASHRMILKPKARVSQINVDKLLDEILSMVKPPRIIS
ncbi:MAG TPA: MoxR family ATPase [Clostridiales bacterium]|nr:MoxR family ATPase [Clostridiales bacterium]